MSSKTSARRPVGSSYSTWRHLAALESLPKAAFAALRAARAAARHRERRRRRPPRSRRWTRPLRALSWATGAPTAHAHAPLGPRNSRGQQILRENATFSASPSPSPSPPGLNLKLTGTLGALFDSRRAADVARNARGDHQEPQDHGSIKHRASHERGQDDHEDMPQGHTLDSRRSSRHFKATSSACVSTKK